MNTTVTIVEILVVGLFGCAWLSLAAMRAAGIEWSLVADSLQRRQHWSTAATAIGALVYQFGWLINGLSRRLMWGFEKSERDLVFGGSEQYDVCGAIVFQKSSSRVNDDLALEQSVIRLARGGVINFSIIGLLVMTSGAGRPGVSAGVVFLILASGSALQWRHRNRRYDKHLADYAGVTSDEGLTPSAQPILLVARGRRSDPCEPP